MEAAEKRHNAQCSNRDYDFFYEGLVDRKILIQQCASCQKLRQPPEPMCPHCHSLEWKTQAMSGSGTIYSYVVHRHPPLPGFNMPHPVGLIELDEGVRVVAALDPIPIEEIKIGMPVTAEFFQRDNVAMVRFRRA